VPGDEEEMTRPFGMDSRFNNFLTHLKREQSDPGGLKKLAGV